MKGMNFFLCLAALVFAGTVFSGCPTEPETGGGADPGNLDSPVTVLMNGPTRYYSLATGQEVLNPASKDWDIAFHYDRLIYTNSGDTARALRSGGLGGVWYTNTTDFNAVTAVSQQVDPSADPSADGLTDYTTDKTVYATPSAAEMGLGPPRTLNVMTYIGYNGGNGSAATPFEDYKFNKKQFYDANLSTMPPIYSTTKWVYIVKHGNGAAYSKVQIPSMESISSAKNGNRRIYTVNYAPLP